MKDLNPFIKELLFSNDCVILPDFGGFIGNYTPARIDRESHTFYPPVKSISFNSKLSHNDGLLIGKISQKKDIAYPDARRIVEDYVEGLRARLKKGERVHLDDIGHFQLNGEGSIQFEPENNVNFLLDSYGLTPFTREPVEDYDISRAISSSRERDHIVTANRRRMVWRAAVALPFVLALVIVPLKTDLFRAEAGMNPLAKVEFEEIRSAQDALFSQMPATAQGDAGLVEPAQDEKLSGQEEPDPGETLSGQEEPDPGETLSGQEEPDPGETLSGQETAVTVQARYYLVVGSFLDAANADRHFNELADSGYDPELVKADNGYYRVSVSSWVSLDKAKEEHRRLTARFPGVWIWKK
ncbi:MAG: HU family DNA-binding protein [Bacteroidota bacterium]